MVGLLFGWVSGSGVLRSVAITAYNYGNYYCTRETGRTRDEPNVQIIVVSETGKGAILRFIWSSIPSLLSKTNNGR